MRDNNYLKKISPAQRTNKKKKKRQAARDKQTHTQEHKETKKGTQESTQGKNTEEIENAPKLPTWSKIVKTRHKIDKTGI